MTSAGRSVPRMKECQESPDQSLSTSAVAQSTGSNSFTVTHTEVLYAVCDESSSSILIMNGENDPIRSVQCQRIHDHVHSVAVCGDASHLCVALRTGEAIVQSTSDGMELARILCPSDTFQVLFNRDGDVVWLVSCSCVQCWRWREGKCSEVA